MPRIIFSIKGIDNTRNFVKKSLPEEINERKKNNENSITGIVTPKRIYYADCKKQYANSQLVMLPVIDMLFKPCQVYLPKVPEYSSS